MQSNIICLWWEWAVSQCSFLLEGFVIIKVPVPPCMLYSSMHVLLLASTKVDSSNEDTREILFLSVMLLNYQYFRFCSFSFSEGIIVAFLIVWDPMFWLKIYLNIPCLSGTLSTIKKGASLVFLTKHLFRTSHPRVCNLGDQLFRTPKELTSLVFIADRYLL